LDSWKSDNFYRRKEKDVSTPTRGRDIVCERVCSPDDDDVDFQDALVAGYKGTFD